MTEIYREVVAAEHGAGRHVQARPVAEGPASGAPVTIVAAEDFACPYCERVSGTLDEPQMKAAGIAPNLVRLACGIEATEDLLADLAQSLE